MNTNRLILDGKSSELLELQKRVAENKLLNLRAGVLDPSTRNLQDLLNLIPMNEISVLDAGCGGGHMVDFLSSISQKTIHYRGIDCSEMAIRAAIQNYPHQLFEIQNMNELRFADRQFQVVLAASVLENIVDYDEAIDELCRVSERFVVLHRCPVNLSAKNEHTIGRQYNVEVSRTYFSEKHLIRRFSAQGFRMMASFGEQTFSRSITSSRDIIQLLCEKVGAKFGPRLSRSYLFTRW